MRRFLPFLALLAATPAAAEPVLIAVGKIEGTADLSAATAAPLESGVAGNKLGGIGSAFDWAGGDSFLALPDRGPNADVYNAAIDNTTSYMPRFHTLTAKLTPATGALSYALDIRLTATTLLYSPTALSYGAAPVIRLNDKTHFYFTGRSDAFGAGSSTDPVNARFDPEGLRRSKDGKSVFISDEYGPNIYRFDAATGERTAAITLPDGFAATHLAPTGETEIAANPVGRIANKGMEGLAITPDGQTLIGIMQSPLAQDGGVAAGVTRIVAIDIASGNTMQYAYPLTNLGTAEKPKYPGISEILAVNDHVVLVDERDGKGLGDDSKAAFKRLYRVDLSTAPVLGDASGETALAARAATKTLFLDVVAAAGAAVRARAAARATTTSPSRCRARSS